MSSRPSFILAAFLCVLSLPALGAETLSGRDVRVFANASTTTIFRFVETAGQKIVLRIVPVDRAGAAIGGGHLVALLPNETRDIDLGSWFDDDTLASKRVKVEGLGGFGRASITSPHLIAVPDAGTAKHRAVSPPVPQPTSSDLIDAAETSGAIDSETALLYRVYLLYGDARLPAKYHGQDEPVTDSMYMKTVRQRFSTLSPATQALVQPFLVPPAYKDSWVNIKSSEVRASETPVRASDSPPPCQFFSDKWAFVDAQTSPVRVWYEADNGADALTASRAATDVDKFWARETGVMHSSGSSTGVPLNDSTESCGGGDSRLDIYLTDMPEFISGEAVAFSYCEPTPAYILIERSAPIGTLIHEIFHAIQDSFPRSSCGLPAGDYLWWMEGSAKWSEDYVESALYPGINSERGWDSKYMQDTKIQLDLSESPLKPYHAYSTYLLPFYVWRSTGNADFVRQTWANCAKEPAIEAFDDAVTDKLEKVWPEFAKRNWNKPPVDDYKKWDGVPFTADPEKPNVKTTGEITTYELKYELPHTSAAYFDLDLSSTNGASIAFWNGVTYKLAERDISGGAIGPQYVSDAANSDDIKGAHITALIRRDEAWTVEDWTSKPFVVYCRDNTADRVDEIVIIISNSEFKDRNFKLKPPGLAPLLFVSNVGCYQWKGSVSSSQGAISTKANVTFTRDDQSITPLSIVYSPQGGVEWSVSAQGCSASGSTGVGLGKLTSFNFLPPDNPAHGTYLGAGSTATLTVCSSPIAFIWWLSPPQPSSVPVPFAKWLTVSSGGRTMADSTSITGATWSWNLSAQKE